MNFKAIGLLTGFTVALTIALAMHSCMGTDKGNYRDTLHEDTSYNAKIRNEESREEPVEVKEADGLTIYYPNYTDIDLVCGERPSKSDERIIMVIAAAYTNQLKSEFSHDNIIGQHVSGGKFYDGKTISGAFVWYDNQPKIVYQDDGTEMRKAANGTNGCGFYQEMLIHDGKTVPHKRKDSPVNEYRALCLIDGRLAVVDSKGEVSFGEFIERLKKAEVTEAVYTDMGTGWNYSWYRDRNGKVTDIHSIPIPYTTNWLTFYR